MHKKNKVKAIVMTLTVLIVFGCAKKRSNPFCFSCIKGNLYFKNCPKYPIFVSENGDSIVVDGETISKKFKKDGEPVCIKSEENRSIIQTGEKCLVYYWLNPFKVKCIKNN